MPLKMTRHRLIIDCDPGVDDAVGLLLAFASHDLELLAVTTVGGNVPGTKTARNARILRQIAGRDDVPVFAGAERPLRREPAGAGEFHGEEGLGDLVPFEPEVALGEGSAVEAIVRLVMGAEAGTVSLAVMGPMTNLPWPCRPSPSWRAI
jgi:purine nucleosidase